MIPQCKGFDAILENQASANLAMDLGALALNGRIAVSGSRFLFKQFIYLHSQSGWGSKQIALNGSNINQLNVDDKPNSSFKEKPLVFWSALIPLPLGDFCCCKESQVFASQLRFLSATLICRISNTLKSWKILYSSLESSSLTAEGLYTVGLMRPTKGSPLLPWP